MDFIEKNYKIIRIFFLVLIFIEILIFNKTYFRLNSFGLPFLIYSVINYLLIVFSFLIIFQIFSLRLRLVFRVLINVFVLFLIYYSVFIIGFHAVKKLGKTYPGNEVFPFFIDLYNTNSLSEFFYREKFSWMSGYFYFHLLILSIGGIADRYIRSVKRNIELKSFNGGLEIAVLKSQLKPYFLLNTLNYIYGLVIKNDKAANTILKLSDLLRFSFYESNNKLIPIKKVVEFLEDYIELEKIRHHNNVNIQHDFSSIENESYKIAPLLFINFVENAFKHGVHHTIESTFVFIKLTQQNNELIFNISNKIPAYANKPKSTGGMGIENVKRRLQLLYPDQHEIKITNDNKLFTVNLKIYTT